jgi:UDP-N-acetyl-D-mannosaminuronic acid dehydrogenase
LANHHPRVNILQPGCGVGGHCIAVDPWFIVDKTPEEARLIRIAREVNDHKPHWVQNKVDAAVADVVEKTGVNRDDVKIACFGLAFKPDIDDLRESPALEITLALAKKYPGQVVAVEPNVNEVPTILCASNVTLAEYKIALAHAHVLVLLVDHAEFKIEKPIFSHEQRLVDAKGIWG